MKNLKIILIATTVAVLAVATVGVVFAHNYGRSYYSPTEYSAVYEDEGWWDEMRDHMEDRWDEVRDEEWFDDMRVYMDDHLDDVENQDWFDEMIQFMEDQRYEYRYQNDTGYGYGYGYHGCH